MINIFFITITKTDQAAAHRHRNWKNPMIVLEPTRSIQRYAKYGHIYKFSSFCKSIADLIFLAFLIPIYPHLQISQTV